MHTKKISEENVFLPGDILCQSKKTKGPCVKKLLFKKCHKKSVEFYFMCENESTKLLIADRLTFCFCRWWNRWTVKSYYTQISVIIIITLMSSWVNGDEQNECEHVSGVEQLLPPETSEETWREETEISAGHKHNQTVNTTNTKLLRDTERLNNNQVFKFSGWMSVRLLDGSQRDKESVQTAQVCHHLSAGRVQRREAQVRLVGHQVGSLHLQDGFVSGQSCQVSVAHHLVVHSGLHTHTHTGNRWVCLCTHWVYEHVRSVFTVMPAAGEPGVLRPPEEGRLTGVTCPSTCDIITQSGSFMFISTQQKCVCVCQWAITFCMTGENLPPVGFQPAAHKQRESLFFWWSLIVTRLSLRIQTDSWRFTSAAEDILKVKSHSNCEVSCFCSCSLTNSRNSESVGRLSAAD